MTLCDANKSDKNEVHDDTIRSVLRLVSGRLLGGTRASVVCAMGNFDVRREERLSRITCSQPLFITGLLHTCLHSQARPSMLLASV